MIPRPSAVYSAFCLALPLIGVVAPKGIVPALLAAALLAAFARWRAERLSPGLDKGAVAVTGVLFAWCAITAIWAFEPVESLVLAGRIMVLFAAGFVLFDGIGSLDDAARARAGYFLSAGVAAALILMAVERALDFPLFRLSRGLSTDDYVPTYIFNRGATAVAMLAWPTAAFLWQRGLGRAALAVPVAAGAVISFLASGAAVVGLAAGLLAALLGLAHRRAGRAIVVLASVVVLLGSPLIAKELQRMEYREATWLSASAKHRVEIWNFALDRIVDRPLLGWGFDASRNIGARNPQLNDAGWAAFPLHPHNGALQVLLELGAVGLAIAGALLWFAARRLERLPDVPRAFGQALFVTTLAIASTAYGLWQNWWIALMLAAAVLVPLSARAAVRPAPDARPGPGG